MRMAKITQKQIERAKQLKQKYCRLLYNGHSNKKLLKRGIYWFNKVINGEITEIPVNTWLYEKLF